MMARMLSLLLCWANNIGTVHLLERKLKMANTFEVAGLSFEAIRFERPRSHWRVKDPSGEIWEAGAAGISGESRPKMKADLEYTCKRIGKDRFVKEFGCNR